MNTSDESYAASTSRSIVARNMIEALSYLIGVASQASFNRVALTLNQARVDLFDEVAPDVCDPTGDASCMFDSPPSPVDRSAKAKPPCSKQ